LDQSRRSAGWPTATKAWAGITALQERGALDQAAESVSVPCDSLRAHIAEQIVVGSDADSAAPYQARLLSIFSTRASMSARRSTIKQGEAV
jgi:hypothetical protein